MRKVTRQICTAFVCGQPASVGNSSTDGKALFLHGNKIAERRDGSIWISDAGSVTNTTKERLNGLIEMIYAQFPDRIAFNKIYQKDFSWYRRKGEDFPSNEFVKA